MIYQGTLVGHTDMVLSVSTIGATNQLVSGSEDGNVRLWGKLSVVQWSLRSNW